jgi:hypothetical protein
MQSLLVKSSSFVQYLFFSIIDFASNDFNQKLQAMFVCPRKWRPEPKQVISSKAKRSIIDEVDIDEELDDFYLF